LLPNSASGAHITQAALILQRKLLVANDVFVAEDAADTAAVGVGDESGKLTRSALLSGAVGSWKGFDDSAGIAGGDGVSWDVLDAGVSLGNVIVWFVV